MHMCGHVPKNTMPVFPPCSQEVEEFDIQYVTRKEKFCVLLLHLIQSFCYICGSRTFSGMPSFTVIRELIKVDF